MLRCTTLIAAALVPTAALAAPVPTMAEKDGYKFEYVTQVDGGKVVLDGRLLDNSQKFTFTVLADGRVYGSVGGTPVEFAISRKQRDRLMSDLAAEQQLAGSELATAGK
jgi:hypothetical protein